MSARWRWFLRDSVPFLMVAFPVGLVVFVLASIYWQKPHGEGGRLEVERVGLDDLFLDAVRVDCPADPAYAHASECIRTRRGVGFFFVDDNGVPRVVSVVGVGRIQ